MPFFDSRGRARQVMAVRWCTFRSRESRKRLSCFRGRRERPFAASGRLTASRNATTTRAARRRLEIRIDLGDDLLRPTPDFARFRVAAAVQIDQYKIVRPLALALLFLLRLLVLD